MKNKFNLKLTLCLVSLFVSLLLLVLGKWNKVCLSFGVMMMGVTLLLYGLFKMEQLNKDIVEADNQMIEIQNEDNEDVLALEELIKFKKKLKRNRFSVSISFSICSICLIILAIAMMI